MAPVHETAEIEATIKKLGQEPGGALMLAPDAFMFRHHKLIIEVATRSLLPTMYFNRDFAAAGGLRMASIRSTSSDRQQPMSIGYCEAPRRAICRCSSRPSLS